jgi:hypothetical protein
VHLPHINTKSTIKHNHMKSLRISFLTAKPLSPLLFISTLLTIVNPVRAASPVGDVVGKISVGYQGWFACIGDGAPINGWWHWSANWSQPPSPSNNAIPAWPDVREYTTTYQTAYANLNNGQPAKLFSSYDQQTVNTHFLWMQQNSIDTAALQRFNPNTGEGPTRDAMATKVRTAAETYGRKFYIMYDVTGWAAMQTEIKTDWTSKMSALIASSAYAKQNGKPVVCIWGLGLNDSAHPWTPAVCLDVVNWFKGQGCYVIGGVRREWRTADSTYVPMYTAMNMISPWLIGAVGNINDADNVYNTYMIGDQSFCNANNIDYQPCVLPGDLSIHQRVHGDLMWHMFYNAKRVGCQGIYASMFDEFGEANQIAKTAENSSFVPSNSGLLALDEDGTPCSADYYLRLTDDGGRMLKGIIALTATRPTETGGSSPNNGSVYHIICVQSGKAMDNRGSTTEGTEVDQWANQGSNVNQEWKLVDVGGGYFNLVCQKSGEALDNSGSSSDGTIMKQWAVQSGNQNQHWQFVSTGNGCYNIICQVGGKTLDNGGSTSDGTAVKQWTVQSGNVNQQWLLQFIR